MEGWTQTLTLTKHVIGMVELLLKFINNFPVGFGETGVDIEVLLLHVSSEDAVILNEERWHSQCHGQNTPIVNDLNKCVCVVNRWDEELHGAHLPLIAHEILDDEQAFEVH